MPPPEKGFEETRRLVDLQLYVLHLIALQLDVKRAFALDPGQRVNLIVRGLLLGSRRSLSSLPCGTARPRH